MAEVLEAAALLFASLNEEKVRYCHWKSNEHLLEGLAGQTDLDVLGKKQSSASCQLKRTKYYIQTDIL